MNAVPPEHPELSENIKTWVHSISLLLLPVILLIAIFIGSSPSGNLDVTSLMAGVFSVALTTGYIAFLYFLAGGFDWRLEQLSSLRRIAFLVLSLAVYGLILWGYWYLVRWIVAKISGVPFSDLKGKLFTRQSQTQIGTGPKVTPKVTQEAGQRNMLFGALWFIGGIVLTVTTYSSAQSSGGTYYICWGAIILGFIQFLQGVFQVINAPAPERKRIKIQNVPQKIEAPKLGESEIKELILVMDTDQDWEKRLDAAEALARSNDVRGLDYLNESLKSSNPDIGLNAAEVLAQLNDPRGLDHLNKLLTSSNFAVRETAKQIISDLEDGSSFQNQGIEPAASSEQAASLTLEEREQSRIKKEKQKLHKQKVFREQGRCEICGKGLGILARAKGEVRCPAHQGVLN